MVPRAGFEHATTRSSAERSPGLSYLGTDSWDAPPKSWKLFSLCHGYLFTFSFCRVMFVGLPLKSCILRTLKDGGCLDAEYCCMVNEQVTGYCSAEETEKNIDTVVFAFLEV